MQADLASYGKVIGGGMPLGVLAGKARFMDALDGGMWNYGDDSFPEAGVTFFAGTFVRHPLTIAVCNAVLRQLKEGGPQLQQDLNRRSDAFCRELNQFFQSQGAPLEFQNCGSILFLERSPPRPPYRSLTRLQMVGLAKTVHGPPAQEPGEVLLDRHIGVRRNGPLRRIGRQPTGCHIPRWTTQQQRQRRHSCEEGEESHQQLGKPIESSVLAHEQDQTAGSKHSDRQSKGIDLGEDRHIGEQQPGNKTHRSDRERAGEQAHQQIQRQISPVALLKSLQQ